MVTVVGSSLDSWLWGSYVRGNYCSQQGCWWPLLLTFPKLMPAVYAFHQFPPNESFLNLVPTFTSHPCSSLLAADWKMTISNLFGGTSEQRGSHSPYPQTPHFYAKLLPFDSRTIWCHGREALDLNSSVNYFTIWVAFYSWNLKWTIRKQSGLHNFCSFWGCSLMPCHSHFMNTCPPLNLF